jgi:hypothetical protein
LALNPLDSSSHLHIIGLRAWVQGFWKKKSHKEIAKTNFQNALDRKNGIHIIRLRARVQSLPARSRKQLTKEREKLQKEISEIPLTEKLEYI